MALPCPSRAMQTIYWWNPCLDHFWLAPGQKNKLQQKSFKLSSFISGTESFHQKFSVSNSKYKNWQRLARVKIKNLNIRIFHKFLLKIKLMYICCYLHIEINTPIKILRARMTPWKFFMFILRFSWGKADQVIGASLMLSCYLQFPSISFSSTHLGFFFLISAECQEIELTFMTYG